MELQLKFELLENSILHFKKLKLPTNLDLVSKINCRSNLPLQPDLNLQQETRGSNPTKDLTSIG